MNLDEPTSLSSEDLRRYDNRSGFDLVSCQEVGLPVYKLTVDALTQIRIKDSQERLMIISPWIRAKSVNGWFLQQFENLLKRGVQVFIGYGLGEKDENRYPTDIQAEESLQKLARQYSKTFKLKRLGDTHAKILIVDTKFAVSTSFNWLSFKGERDRTFRDERGTLVSDPQKIDELFNNLLRRFTSD
ncbi:MAG: phospholipase D-like domain-containing protein [Nostoc sp.]|uniref:phospholipase D-like domain-containing protein n=1 Tax=Nostoc sp. TaxID=1180 RepID=UPI002FFD1E64